MRHTAAVLAAAACLLPTARADEPSRLLADAASAFRAGKYDQAADLAQRAADAAPNDPTAPALAGRAYAAAGRYDAAVRAFTAALGRDPKQAAVYDARGDAHLKLGKFREAVADFDAFLAARPGRAPDHWRRGIALYCAGRYADGAKQFDLHRTVNPQDVENSAWHYLCTARAAGRETARKALLPVTGDARVPMPQVLEMFAGRLKPQDVIDAADRAGLAGDRLTAARFYARLYVGLFFEAEGDAAKAKEYLAEAVEKYKVPDYMWDVANVRLKALAAK
ncbi:MAG TPA: tetratricopeptide repeat protein [Gemmataceae bacterium]|jgi:lipoprotein NlpI